MEKKQLKQLHQSREELNDRNHQLEVLIENMQ